MKKCKKCNELKSLDSFSNCRKAKDKKQTHCQPCKYKFYTSNLKLVPIPLLDKKCTTCNLVKTIDNFRTAKNTADGYRPECKACKYLLDRNYRRQNLQRHNELNRIYARNNSAKVLANTRKYQVRKYGNYYRHITSEQKQAIVAIYNLCRLVNMLTGIPHEVDHIIPLQGENVTGFHIPENLQIIPASDNRKKSNKLKLE